MIIALICMCVAWVIILTAASIVNVMQPKSRDRTECGRHYEICYCLTMIALAILVTAK